MPSELSSASVAMRAVEGRVRPSLTAIFLCFFTIGSQSFGGGVSAWIRREIVQKRGWLDDQQFLSCLAICQIAPGPNPMNMAVFIGNRLRGTAGTLAAFAGLMLVPVLLCLVLGELYFAGQKIPKLEVLLGGLGAVAIAMNVANGVRLMRKNIRKHRQIAVVISVAVAVGLFHAPLLYTLAVAVPVGVVLEWKSQA